MSSVYRILCMSHDPAVVHNEYDSAEAALVAIAGGIADHPTCDLLVGQYSYPLVAVGCPPVRHGIVNPAKGCYLHANAEWVDAAWLRLLAVAKQLADDKLSELVKDGEFIHWTWARLWRLRFQLGIEDKLS